MNVSDNEIKQISDLSDKLLEVVMNTELESAEAGLAALLHVATTLAVVMQMSESEFAACALECFQTGKQATQEHEVH
jgi:ABC-type tungstate transport system substrate-binding protein